MDSGERRKSLFGRGNPSWGESSPSAFTSFSSSPPPSPSERWTSALSVGSDRRQARTLKSLLSDIQETTPPTEGIHTLPAAKGISSLLYTTEAPAVRDSAELTGNSLFLLRIVACVVLGLSWREQTPPASATTRQQFLGGFPP